MNKDERVAAVMSRLRKLADEIDEQTRLPGEKPLRVAMAEQARERLAELDATQAARADARTTDTTEGEPQ